MKWSSALLVGVCMTSMISLAQTGSSPSPAELNARIERLEAEVQDLKQIVHQLQDRTEAPAPQPVPVLLPASATVRSASIREDATAQAAVPGAEHATQSVISADDRKSLDFLRDTTINLGLDTYYEYNFNNPVGRVNLLRAYDVLSNEFSLNQASLVVEHAPDPSAGRRWGGRLDLQFGQATDTLQGNPSNEPRPDIYRNIFQAYGTYVVPVGKGLTVDFGKWSSSLGIEGNYTKDQVNYSRSFFFDYLPFYHMGVRASYKVNDKLSANYWIVNGTDQTEPTNSYKDELFGFTAQPAKNISWTANYYVGQDHPDVTAATNCTVPVQPGLCLQPISP